VQGGQDKSLGRRDVEIFLVSVLVLYLELMLIRWVGTEIRVFAYLGNLVLVICFFGTGLGCHWAARPILWTRLGVNVLVVTALVANPLNAEFLDLRNVNYWLGGFEDSPLWSVFTGSYVGGVVAALLILGVMLYLIAWTFFPLGQVLGRALQQHPRTIRAYSVNIAGSLAGVWVFNALSWMAMPPVVWFGAATVVVGLLTFLLPRPSWWAAALLAVATGLVCLQSMREPPTIWSPYQKLTVRDFTLSGATNSLLVGYSIEANGLGYQAIVNLDDRFMAAHPDFYDKEQAALGAFNLAFSFKQPVRRLLVVGAGTGNNAAAALRHGVEQTDCVEIDPQIYALGRQLHPEHPYDSPRVRMVVDDARAYLKRTHESYDMIWFGLLDTHPGSSFNNRRVDHYVYTLECFQEARRLLTEDGLLLMNFGSRRPWIADRLVGMLRQVFGEEPLAYDVGGFPLRYGAGGEFTVVCTKRQAPVPLPLDPVLRGHVEAHRVSLPGNTRPTTDDWPYLYLQTAKIPRLHLLAGLTVLVTIIAARRRIVGIAGSFDWHFFALGAAFLLLEVQTVSRATLLFGMTWVVNAIVISAVLVMILLSNLVAARWPRFPQRLIVAGLTLTVVALAFVPLDWFNALTGSMKLVVASAFLTAPVFFAGLLFIRSFAACSDKANALGSNLIGALVGGLLESLSYVTGMRALVLLVGLFYVAALLLRPRVPQDLPTAD
jgi:spermidine synthase